MIQTLRFANARALAVFGWRNLAATLTASKHEASQLPPQGRSTTLQQKQQRRRHLPANMEPNAASQPRPSKKRDALVAVGGFVVGASAVSAVVGLRGVFGKGGWESSASSLLREGPFAATNDAGSAEAHSTAPAGGRGAPVPSNSPTERRNARLPTSAPADEGRRPTAMPARGANELDASFAWAGATSTLIPTVAPTRRPDTRFPTHAPTYETAMPTAMSYEYDVEPSHVVAPLHALRRKELGIRLRLYWEAGYFWQEDPSDAEKWW